MYITVDLSSSYILKKKKQTNFLGQLSLQKNE